MMLRCASIRQFQMSGVKIGSGPSIPRRSEYHSLDSIEKVARQTFQPKRLKIVKLMKVNDRTRKMDEPIPQVDPLALHRCDHCAESFLSSLDLAEHTATAHPVAVDFPCDQCAERYQVRSELLQHVAEAHHSVPKSDCATNGDLVTEKIGPLGPQVFHCPSCDFVSRSNLALKSHFARKHTENYEYKCELCPKKFKVKVDLTNHVRFHHKAKPVECDVCGKVYKNSASLYVHQKWTHYKPKFECPICHRRVVTQENLDQHMLMQHEKREKIACAECGKIFPKLSRLKKHLAVHSDKPYKCYVCKKVFVLKADLTNHLPVHNSSRPFSCDICGMAFAQRSSLVSHEKSHESDDSTVADDCKEDEEEDEGLEAEYEEQIEEILEIVEYKPA